MSGGWGKRALIGPVLVMAALALWPLRRAVFAGEALYYRDVHLVWHPQVEAFVRAVTGGSWPVWDPGPAFGKPLLADPSAMIGYPPTWLNLLMPAWLYYTLFVITHLLGSGIGLFLLARRWRSSPMAGLTGAAAWMLSGPMLSLTSLWHHFAGTCWMPWVLLAADRALLRRRWRDAAVWGLASGAQILAGSADVVAMTLSAVAVLAVVHHVRWRRPLAPAHRARVAVAGVAVALAVGLAAVAWVPALDIVRRSGRETMDEAARTYWSVHPASLTQAVLPWHWEAMPIHSYVRARLFESREPFLGSLYLGLATLPLVGAALAGRRPRARFLGVLVTLGVLVALGRYAPVYSVLCALVPPLKILRYPAKAWILVAFAWSLLCALGLEAWRAGRPVHRRAWAWAVVVPAALFGLAALAAAAAVHWAPVMVRDLLLDALAPDVDAALATMGWRLLGAGAVGLASAALAALRMSAPPRRARALAGAAGALAVADLLAMHATAVPTAPRQLYARPPVVDVLRAQGVARLYSYDYYSSFRARRLLDRQGRPQLVAIPPGFERAAAYSLAQQLHLTPSVADRWGMETGFERDEYGLYTEPLAELVRRLVETEGTPSHLRLLRMGAVTHVVALHDGMQDLQLLGMLPGLYERAIRVLAVPGPLPRAYAVRAARTADERNAVAALLDPSFDPAGEVILTGAPAEPAPPGPAGDVHIEERRADTVRLRADMVDEGYVVLLDAYRQGWRAWVDGRPQPLLRANAVFRAVRLPRGSHTIEMRYRPPAALLGLAVTLASAAAAAALAARRVL